MKEIKFEISIPEFFYTKKTWEQMRVGLSIVWVVAIFFIATSYALAAAEMAILAYLGISIIWKLSSRISAFLALVLLASEPFLLYLKNDALAETLAVYAFYFLVITVIQEIIFLRKGDAKGI